MRDRRLSLGQRQRWRAARTGWRYCLKVIFPAIVAAVVTALVQQAMTEAQRAEDAVKIHWYGQYRAGIHHWFQERYPQGVPPP